MEPKEPNAADCCGSGCARCVFDIYREQLAAWQAGNTHGHAHHRLDLLSETCFQPFKLLRIEKKLTPDVLRLRFQPLTDPLNVIQERDISGTLPYAVSQHLMLRLYQNSGDSLSETEPEKKLMVTRAYTPISISDQEKNCCFDIVVKLYKGGIASEYFRRSQIGQIFYWRGPCGEFQYKPNTFRYILMVCMGSGLAPMIPLINYVVANEQDETCIHLLCGFRSLRYVILRDHLCQLTCYRYWNFTMEYYLSELDENNITTKFGENCKYRRIDKTSLEDYVLGKDLNKMLVLICGTDLFTSQIKDYVADLGIETKTNIHIF